MESLTETKWDLVLSGTGLSQSLLALALSRSGKKILHVDQNNVYGGADAALSLQDAKEWVEKVAEAPSMFRDAEITTSEGGISKLGSSRAYSLALSPQIIYARSALLPTLVSSKVYRQLEFLAVGSWWLYEADEASDSSAVLKGSLKKIPGGREDVFADKSIDLKAKRSLMRFLKVAVDPTAQAQALDEWGEKPLQDMLTQQYGVPLKFQAALHALTLSPDPPNSTLSSYALPRITRHLTSTGVFGPGFCAVIPRWGGLAEIAQVGCRAGAVGGGIYMLGKGIESIKVPTTSDSEGTNTIDVVLQGGEIIQTRYVAGCRWDLPPAMPEKPEESEFLARSIFIVSSPLSRLLLPLADGAPPPACAIVVFPAVALSREGNRSEFPVHLMVHSSDTGECPMGQSVIYASVKMPALQGYGWLDQAVRTLLAFTEDPAAQIIYTLHYSQRSDPDNRDGGSEGDIKMFPGTRDGLAWDDTVLADVRRVWQSVSGQNDGFMQFEDREVGAYDDDE